MFEAKCEEDQVMISGVSMDSYFECELVNRGNHFNLLLRMQALYAQNMDGNLWQAIKWQIILVW